MHGGEPGTQGACTVGCSHSRVGIGFSPGASLCCACSKPFLSIQHIHGAGTKGYSSQATPPHPIHPLHPPLGTVPQGGWSVLGIVAFPLLCRQSQWLSGLFFIRKRLLLGHPGPRHWSGRGFAANPGGCAGGSAHIHTCIRTHAHAHPSCSQSAKRLPDVPIHLHITPIYLSWPSRLLRLLRF